MREMMESSGIGVAVREPTAGRRPAIIESRAYRHGRGHATSIGILEGEMLAVTKNRSQSACHGLSLSARTWRCRYDC